MSDLWETIFKVYAAERLRKDMQRKSNKIDKIKAEIRKAKEKLRQIEQIPELAQTQVRPEGFEVER